ncbi:uncharacterized protein BDV17DRAFT_292478 [Aspergillus undulatus]|uniref:uncharacterized protein n=1 Tax=Aspergillus undulatus TaxID=1810928 RepID=UPI003CCDBA94
MIVVREQDYQLASQELQRSEFPSTLPNRSPPKEILESLPDLHAVLDAMNSGYKRLDESTLTFDYPLRLTERDEQVVLIPSSFPHIEMHNLPSSQRFQSRDYDKYENLVFLSERLLLESLVRTAMDAEEWDDDGFLIITSLGEMLRSWISQMVGYLGLQTDILNGCSDERVVSWYSRN